MDSNSDTTNTCSTVEYINVAELGKRFCIADATTKVPFSIRHNCPTRFSLKDARTHLNFNDARNYVLGTTNDRIGLILGTTSTDAYYICCFDIDEMTPAAARLIDYCASTYNTYIEGSVNGGKHIFFATKERMTLLDLRKPPIEFYTYGRYIMCDNDRIAAGKIAVLNRDEISSIYNMISDDLQPTVTAKQEIVQPQAPGKIIHKTHRHGEVILHTGTSRYDNLIERLEFDYNFYYYDNNLYVDNGNTLRKCDPAYIDYLCHSYNIYNAKGEETVYGSNQLTRIVSQLKYKTEAAGNVIEFVADAPYITPNGDYIHTRGFYDGVFLDRNYPDVDIMPLDDCLKVIWKMLDAYNFVSDADKTAAFVGIISAYAYHAIGEQAPIFLINKTQQGAGGSFLSSMASNLMRGCNGDVFQFSAKSGDMSNILYSLSKSHTNFPIIDNLNEYLDSPIVAGYVTDENGISVRKMYTQESVAVKCRGLLNVNGNNIEISPDMVERSLMCRIGRSKRTEMSSSEFYETFGHDLHKAFVSIVIQWVKQDKPTAIVDNAHLNRFPKWKKCIAGLCQMCGITDFLANADDAKEELDKENNEAIGFINAIFETLADPGKSTVVFTSEEVYDAMVWEGGTGINERSLIYQNLPESAYLNRLGDRRATVVRISRYLGKFVNKDYDDLKLASKRVTQGMRYIIWKDISIHSTETLQIEE